MPGTLSRHGMLVPANEREVSRGALRRDGEAESGQASQLFSVRGLAPPTHAVTQCARHASSSGPQSAMGLSCVRRHVTPSDT